MSTVEVWSDDILLPTMRYTRWLLSVMVDKLVSDRAVSI